MFEKIRQSKKLPYVSYVQSLMQELFLVSAKISIKKTGHRDVYIGSTKMTRWLKSQGLVENKARGQVDVPTWILLSKNYLKSFTRASLTQMDQSMH